MDLQKGANWANIGAFFIALLSLLLALATFAFMLWSRWYPDPARAPGFEIGQNNKALIIIGSSLFIASIIQISLFRSLRRGRKSDSAKATGQTETEQALIASNARVTELGRAVSNLQERYDDLESDTKWLVDIAQDQAQSIYRFVHLNDVRLGKHELLRSDPYIEFLVTVDNRSLFDIAFLDLSGFISFAARELGNQPIWQAANPITQGNTGSVTIRQRLSKEDVIHILNGSPQDQGFDFGGLQVRVEGTHNLKPTLLHTHHIRLANDELLNVYPKLDITIAQAFYDWLFDLRKPSHNGLRNPLFVTALLDITNRRHISITIDTFRMNITVKGKEYTSFADAGEEVYVDRHVNEDGKEIAAGQRFINLSRPIPLILPEGKSLSGALQFVFYDLEWGEIVDEPNSVNGTPFTLLLIDKDGERHAQLGILKHKNEAHSKHLATKLSPKQ